MRGETWYSTSRKAVIIDFNPLSPCGERHIQEIINELHRIFQSTLPMRGETLTVSVVHILIYTISIHSPHAGRDVNDVWRTHRKSPISIHSPHAGRDGAGEESAGLHVAFQSTLPMRGET